jgi:hypothetical protein
MGFSTTTTKNCFRYLKLMSPLNVAFCTTISYTLWVEWYYLKNNYLTLRSKSRSHEGHYATQYTALWSCTHIPNIIDLSRKTKMYVSPSNEGRHIVLVWFFLLLLLSKVCQDHNFFVFRDMSMIFGIWVHDHKAVCRVP